jgi:hypothetical protein
VPTTIVRPRSAIESAYVERLRSERLSEETIRQRVYVMRRLACDPVEAREEDIRAALGTGISPSSQSTYLQVFRAIYADFQRMEWVGADPTRWIKPPRVPRREPRPMPRHEIDALLSCGNDDVAAWTTLGFYAGLRAGEVVQVSSHHLETSAHGRVLRVVGKGGLDALIPAHDRVVQLLECRPAGTLWPIWPKSVQRAWSRQARMLGIHGRVFHQLRHSYCTALYQATAGDLVTVARLARHASVATTQRYAAVADDRPFTAIQAL